MSNSLVVTITSNSGAVFSPNQIVAGEVELRINRVVKARSLRLVVKGKAECKWSESRGSSSNYVFGKQQYLESVNFLFGSGDADPTDVPVGVHTYNFACLLPEGIPSSIEGVFGFIRYKVEATLDIPWDLDLRSVKPFTVVRHDDLNLIQTPILRQPCEVEKIKTFCCLFCESDPVIMTMKLPKSGFGLGETIPIHVEVVNGSTTNIMSTEFLLRKIEEYNSSEPTNKTRMCCSNVTSKTSRGVARLQTKKFDESLRIPEILTTSNDRLCSVFQIKYCVTFKAYPVGLNTSFDLETMITIGNIGILDAAPDSPPSFEEATRLKNPISNETPLVNT